MNQRPAPVSRVPDRFRWLLVAVVVLIGIGLYFWYAPSSRPAAPPPVETE